MDEVGNPTILATFAVIAAILPMAFVGGLMGPYMRPIPVGASVAMLFSLLVAFMVSPWAAIAPAAGAAPARTATERARRTGRRASYRRLMAPLLRDWQRRVALPGASSCSCCWRPARWCCFKLVRVKMLPFDNKSELQVIVDMPEGTTLEETARVSRELGDALAHRPEVTDLQLYVGTAAPYNFNGLVRHYFLRQGPNVADIQVNLLPKDERTAQSHDIAKRVRPRAAARSPAPTGRAVKVAEVPPGPPVLQTLVAEVYGDDRTAQLDAARRILGDLRADAGRRGRGLVRGGSPSRATASSWTRRRPRCYGVSDRPDGRGRCASPSAARAAGLAHLPTEKEDVPIFLRLPARPAERSGRARRRSRLKGASGALVPLVELVRVEATTEHAASSTTRT